MGSDTFLMYGRMMMALGVVVLVETGGALGWECLVIIFCG